MSNAMYGFILCDINELLNAICMPALYLHVLAIIYIYIYIYRYIYVIFESLLNIFLSSII